MTPALSPSLRLALFKRFHVLNVIAKHLTCLTIQLVHIIGH